MHQGSVALVAVEQGLRGPYNTIHLPKEMNFTMLLDVSGKSCLPLSVPLSLNCKGTQCTHTIGMYPIRPIGGGPFKFQIVDGAHPDLKSIALSTENIDWCCGDLSFTTTAGSFVLLPYSKRSQCVPKRLEKTCGTLDALCSSGISSCLDTGPIIHVPDYLSQFNGVVKTPEGYMEIVAPFLLYGKGQSCGKGDS